MVEKVAFHVARAFGDIEMNRVTSPTCTRVLLTAHQVVILLTRATTWPVVGLREVLCADIAHRKQVCDVEVLRSRDGERCLVATIAADDVDMRIPRPPALRGKIAPPFETQLDVCNVGPGNLHPSFEVAILGTTRGYDLVDARRNRYAIASVRVDHPTTRGKRAANSRPVSHASHAASDSGRQTGRRPAGLTGGHLPHEPRDGGDQLYRPASW